MLETAREVRDRVDDEVVAAADCECWEGCVNSPERDALGGGLLLIPWPECSGELVRSTQYAAE